jgi:hypothetical protein
MKQATKELRNAANDYKKALKAEARHLIAIELGKTVIETEVPTGEFTEDGKPVTKKVLSFPATGPKNGRGRVKQPQEPQVGIGQSTALAFLGAKSHKHAGAQAKSRPGNKELHAAAIPENQAFTALALLAKQEAAKRAIDLSVPVTAEDLAQ